MTTSTSTTRFEPTEMNASSTHRFNQSLTTKRQEKTIKLVMFTINELNFALRIESVNKVVNQTRVIYSNEQARIGIAHMGEFEITVVDLQEKLTAPSATTSRHRGLPTKNDYLIIAQGDSEELIGIPVKDAPILMEIPLSKIRALPKSYQRADQINLASHVTLISQASDEITIFLMDINRVLGTTCKQDDPTNSRPHFFQSNS